MTREKQLNSCFTKYPAIENEYNDNPNFKREARARSQLEVRNDKILDEKKKRTVMDELKE